MNFRDYLDIIGAEGLDESPLADGILLEVSNLERQIKILSKHEGTEEVVKRMTEEKIASIWTAIDLARFQKEDKEIRDFIQQEFSEQAGYEHKGFIHEFKMMKENAD